MDQRKARTFLQWQLGVAALLLLGGASAAAAPEPTPAAKEQAEKLKKGAFDRFGAGDYAAGIEAMEQAYALVPATGYLLNIAFAYDLWGGHCPEATAAFQRFFDACKDKVCPDLPKATERFGRLRERCNAPAPEKKPEAPAAAAPEPAPTAPPPVEETPPPPSPPVEAAPPPPPVTAPPPEPEDGGTSPWIWVAIGAAAVGGGVALAFALGSKSPDPYGGTLETVFGK